MGESTSTSNQNKIARQRGSTLAGGSQKLARQIEG